MYCWIQISSCVSITSYKCICGADVEKRWRRTNSWSHLTRRSISRNLKRTTINWGRTWDRCWRERSLSFTSLSSNPDMRTGRCLNRWFIRSLVIMSWPCDGWTNCLEFPSFLQTSVSRSSLRWVIYCTRCLFNRTFRATCCIIVTHLMYECNKQYYVHEQLLSL